MAGACITVRVPASLALLRKISAQTANAATIDFVLPSRAEQGHIPLIFASKQLQCPGSARIDATSPSIKPTPPCQAGDRKSVVSETRVDGHHEPGGRRTLKQKQNY